ncbi:unnamed protein product [Citrullus colocynthis]|uniref:Uncharacterized protein n=1 Tax=Citrullus colocynthis TaxID=252529 RepID=A0ABP0XSW9_9ROSI
MGPPGAGKTKTVAVLLLEFRKNNRRALTYAPTNTAIMQKLEKLFSNKEEEDEEEEAVMENNVEYKKLLKGRNDWVLTVMAPLETLVIDEAAQLKECEAALPLQVPSIKHAILIGDECQLPAVVESKIADEAGIERSLFERLSSLGYKKHLLNVQHRMHPSISYFPNSKFYSNQISDGPNVKTKAYGKKFLHGPMFGSYSFIDINVGKEEKDGITHSWKNMVEVDVVVKIIQNLFKACVHSKEKISIGVISPYSAQVAAIEEKIGRDYSNCNRFNVKVCSIDGFQGGEEDIIIISRLVDRSDSIWEELALDAINRSFCYQADEDKDLANAMASWKMDTKIYINDLAVGKSSNLQKTNPFEHENELLNMDDDALEMFEGSITHPRAKKLLLTLPSISQYSSHDDNSYEDEEDGN